jgi:hypothetical protein
MSALSPWPVATRALPGCAGGSLLWGHRGRLFLTAAVRCSYALDASMQRVEAQPLERVDVPYRRLVDVTLTGHAVVDARDAAPVVRLRIARGAHVVCDVTRRLRPTAGVPLTPVEGMGALALPLAATLGEHRGRPVLELEGRSGAEPSAEAMQRAPLDMRVPYLHGDEWIDLGGLRPGASFRAQLPRAAAGAWSAQARLRLAGGGWALQELPLDTLHLDVDTWRCHATWRGWVELDRARDLAGAELQLGVRHDAELVWPEEQPEGDLMALLGGTLDVTDAEVRVAFARPALPFAGRAPAPPLSPGRSILESGTLDGGGEERYALPLAIPAPPAARIVEDPSVGILGELLATADAPTDAPLPSTPFVRGPAAPPPIFDVPLALFSGTNDLTYEEARAAAAARMTPFERDPEVKQGSHFLAALERVQAGKPRR